MNHYDRHHQQQQQQTITITNMNDIWRPRLTRQRPVNVSMLDVTAHSYDGIASRGELSLSSIESFTVPAIHRLASSLEYYHPDDTIPTTSNRTTTASFPFDDDDDDDDILWPTTHSSILTPNNKNRYRIKSSLRTKPKEELSILDQKSVRFAAVIADHNEGNDDDEETDPAVTMKENTDITNNVVDNTSIIIGSDNKTNHAWNWAMHQKRSTIKDSPPKRRRRHRRSSSSFLDFAAEILPKLHAY